MRRSGFTVGRIALRSRPSPVGRAPSACGRPSRSKIQMPGKRARRRRNTEGHAGPTGKVRRGAEEGCERKRAAPAFAGGVAENSRWSSASGPTGVIAKNEAARTPPDRITPTDASRQGCGIMRRTDSGMPRTPSGVRFSFARFPVVFAPPGFSRRLPHLVRRSTTGYFSVRPLAYERPIFRAEGRVAAVATLRVAADIQVSFASCYVMRGAVVGVIRRSGLACGRERHCSGSRRRTAGITTRATLCSSSSTCATSSSMKTVVELHVRHVELHGDRRRAPRAPRRAP